VNKKTAAEILAMNTENFARDILNGQCQNLVNNNNYGAKSIKSIKSNQEFISFI
jgi:hypothetical protein